MQNKKLLDFLCSCEKNLLSGNENEAIEDIQGLINKLSKKRRVKDGSMVQEL